MTRPRVSRIRRIVFPLIVLAVAGALALGGRMRNARAAAAWAESLPAWCRALAERSGPGDLRVADPLIEGRVHAALAEFGRAELGGRALSVDVERGDIGDLRGAIAHAQVTVPGEGGPPRLVLRLARSGGELVVIGYLRPDGPPDLELGSAPAPP